MSSHPAQVPVDCVSPSWREIEDLLDELARAAESAPSEIAYYRMLLDRIVPAIGVGGAALWTAQRPGVLRREYQVHRTPAPARDSADHQAARMALVNEVIASGQPRVVPPGVDVGGAGVDGDGSDCTVFLYPFAPGLRQPGVVEIICQGKVSTTAGHGYLRVLAALVELIADFDHKRELAELREHKQTWRQDELFALGVHGSLDPRETAYRIANDGRRLLGCDRVSVLVRRGAALWAVAISGVDVLEPRAQQVRLLEQLAQRASAAGEPLWYHDGLDDVAEEVERPLHDYLDESRSRVLAILPLQTPGDDRMPGEPRVFGVVVVEKFQVSADDANLRSRAAALAGHAAVALGNAEAHYRMPLASVGRWLANVRWLTEARQLPRTILALAAAVSIIAALAIIPADFDIEARGELQPTLRRDVFASDDGVVSELLADHGRATRRGEPLVVLRKPQLELESSRVAGEIQTAQKKLAAVQAERLTNVQTDPDARRTLQRLTADEEELKKLLEGLRDQQAILEAQRAELTIRSPLDGQALTWNLKELLDARPVQRGQNLLTIADLSGPWKLELHLADDRAGHVLAARAEQGDALDVSFALTSDPGTVYRGTISDMALSTELDDKSTSTVLVTVDFDRQAVQGLRPGATVIAQIHCGRRALGYVWLHELWEAIQSHWWW